MKVTVCEMGDEPEKFSDDWMKLSEHVRAQRSELVLLNEMPFYQWFAASPRYVPAEWKTAVGAHEDWMERIPELGARVVLGSRPVNLRGKRLNQGFLWTKEGTKGVHFKRYLPNEGGYYEASWYHRGDGSFDAFSALGSRVGMMICSDLWAMPHARKYGRNGADLIVVPRATAKETTEKWMAGGKVAAVVSGTFCLSSNRSGRRGEATFGGSGWIIGPDGQVLGTTSVSQPFVTVELDLKVATKAKKTYPRNALLPD